MPRLSPSRCPTRRVRDYKLDGFDPAPGPAGLCGWSDSSPNLLDVRPGDDKAVNEVEELFLAYRETRDPAIRERIILAHVGLADRLAMRFRGNHGVASEDLVQAARIGLVATVDRTTSTAPTTSPLTEIGGHLGVSEEQVAEVLEAIDTRRQLSLDQPIGEESTTSFGALLPAPDDEVELEDRLSLPHLLEGLGELERQAVVMRFFQDF